MPGDREVPPQRNRLSPLRFVLAFGVVSMLADFVYEGARGVVGPYLATFGASAAVVGLVTGAGEAVALVFRLVTGPLSDHLRRYWSITQAGYLITVVAVPLLAVAPAFGPAAAAVIAERFGKAVRTPARDTMLAHAGTHLGRGKAFALHEALDQSGALLGPLLVAGMIAISGYRAGFAVLVVPGVLALVLLAWLRRAVPHPSAFSSGPSGQEATAGHATAASRRFSPRFWLYTAFAVLTMLGFATFGVLAFHLSVRHVVPDWEIPVVYAAAMGVDAFAAVGFGWIYDRWGLRGLVALPALAAVVPFLSFATEPAAVWAGALVWGAGLGAHESTMRAAVADLVPAARRGTGYGVFTAAYGLAWLAGGAVIGAFYDTSPTALHAFVLATQTAALLAFVALLLSDTRT